VKGAVTYTMRGPLSCAHVSIEYNSTLNQRRTPSVLPLLLSPTDASAHRVAKSDKESDRACMHAREARGVWVGAAAAGVGGGVRKWDQTAVPNTTRLMW
jgi:hypothetical protein